MNTVLAFSMFAAPAPTTELPPSMLAPPVAVVNYATAYHQALAGRRVVVDVEADDPTRPDGFRIGRYVFWTDESGLHHQRIEPVVPEVRRVPFVPAVSTTPAGPTGARTVDGSLRPLPGVARFQGRIGTTVFAGIGSGTNCGALG